MSSLSRLLDHNKNTLATVAHIAEAVVANTEFHKDEQRAEAVLAVNSLHALAADAAKHDNGAHLRALLAPIAAALVEQTIAPKPEPPTAQTSAQASAQVASGETAPDPGPPAAKTDA